MMAETSMVGKYIYDNLIVNHFAAYDFIVIYLLKF